MNEFKDPEREAGSGGDQHVSVDRASGEATDDSQVEVNGESQAAAGSHRGKQGDRSTGETSLDGQGHGGAEPGGAGSAGGERAAGQGRNDEGRDDEGLDDEEEVNVLRSELMRVQTELSEANEHLQEMKDRYLRARADLENYRRRAANDADRAREAGLDSAVLPVLSVFDDLHRALGAADESDPARIIPGIQSVLATLERNLDTLGIKPVGNVGDAFDPDLHEALTSVATDEVEKSETIAEVFQLGFQKDDRLIRPARVIVYQS